MGCAKPSKITQIEEQVIALNNKINQLHKNGDSTARISENNLHSPIKPDSQFVQMLNTTFNGLKNQQEYSNAKFSQSVDFADSTLKQHLQKKLISKQRFVQYNYQLARYYFFKQKYQNTVQKIDSIIHSKIDYLSQSQLNLKIFKYLANHCLLINQSSPSITQLNKHKQELQGLLSQINNLPSGSLIKYEILFLILCLYSKLLLSFEQINRQTTEQMKSLISSEKKQFKIKELFEQGKIYYFELNLNKEASLNTVHLNINTIANQYIQCQLQPIQPNGNNKQLSIFKELPNYMQGEQIKRYYVEQSLNYDNKFSQESQKKPPPQIKNVQDILQQSKICNLYVNLFSLYVHRTTINDNLISLFKTKKFNTVTQDQWDQIVLKKDGIAIKFIPDSHRDEASILTELKVGIKHFLKVEQKIQPNKLDRGLQNIGNTCYMNSALQCLHKSKFFTESLTPAFQQTKAKHKQRTYTLTQQIITFINQLWQDRQALDPRELHSLIYKENYIFKLGKQNDAIQFLITLLSVLGRQLNDPLPNEKVDIDFLNDNQQTIYQKTKKKNEMINKSFLQQVFGGRYRVIFECKICKRRQVRFEKFRVHYLQIPKPEANQSGSWPFNIYQKRQNPQSLQNCLENFKNPQLLSGDNALNCKKCNKQRPTNRVMEICEMNKIFVVCLKRFHDDTKNERLISVPKQVCFENLKIQGKKCKRATYKLYAAILHSGYLNCGHYTAVCFNYLTQKWMKYNDRWFDEQSKFVEEINLDDAYALFFEFNQHQPFSSLDKQLNSQQNEEKFQVKNSSNNLVVENLKKVLELQSNQNKQINEINNKKQPVSIASSQAKLANNSQLNSNKPEITFNYKSPSVISQQALQETELDYVVGVLDCLSRTNILPVQLNKQKYDILKQDSALYFLKNWRKISQKCLMYDKNMHSILLPIVKSYKQTNLKINRCHAANNFLDWFLKKIIREDQEITLKIQKNNSTVLDKNGNIQDNLSSSEIKDILKIQNRVTLICGHYKTLYEYKQSQTYRVEVVDSLIILPSQLKTKFQKGGQDKLPRNKQLQLCTQCRQFQFKESRQVNRASSIFIVQLDKFSKGTHQNHSFIGIMNLNPQSFIFEFLDKRYEGKQYKLIGIISYWGNVQQGKYTTLWLNQLTWWQRTSNPQSTQHPNDLKYIQSVGTHFKNPVILFYELIDDINGSK